MQLNAVTKGAGSVLSVVVMSEDRSLGKTAKQSLGNGAIDVSVTTDADQVIAELEEGSLNLVIVDYEVAVSRLGEILSQAESAHGVPVIVTVSSDDEIPQCLDLGANDFIMKPVHPKELAGRAALHGLGGLRRASMRLPGNGLSIDPSTRRAVVDGETVNLTFREYELLEFLTSRPRVTFTREELLASVWGSSSKWQNPATVTEHIYRLRRKLEPEPDRPRWIVTVRGKGYRLQS